MINKNAAAGLLLVPAMCGAVITAALPMVQRWEDTRLVPYLDLVGKVTGCSGVTENVKLTDRYTKPQCDAMDLHALAKHARGIRACVPDPAPLMMQVAMLVLAYNIGVARFCASTASRLFRAGQYRAACDAILLFDKARKNGVLTRIQGLANRRMDERKACLSGVPA